MRQSGRGDGTDDGVGAAWVDIDPTGTGALHAQVATDASEEPGCEPWGLWTYEMTATLSGPPEDAELALDGTVTETRMCDGAEVSTSYAVSATGDVEG